MESFETLTEDLAVLPKNTEIERRFLFTGHGPWGHDVEHTYYIKQVYLLRSPLTVRIRTSEERDADLQRLGLPNPLQSYLTIKGKSKGAACKEYEWGIPNFIGRFFVWATRSKIEKLRQYVLYGGKTWHVDHFFGANEGLCQAEIELKSEGELFAMPLWIGKEVTHDPRYRNSNLLKNPWKSWGKIAA